MAPCKVDGCPALAVTRGVCAIHAKYPDFRPGDELVARDGSEDCDKCGGSGLCQRCDGDSVIECNMGHNHDCPDCDGTGDCPECLA